MDPRDPRDPRQPPQHPFSRNTTSPYGRTPFPPSSNQAPFPPASHPQNAPPPYAEHQRRPSDPPYYNQPRNYGQDGPPMGGGHSRHQSASSAGHGTPVNRAMPPPSSPQQQGPQQQPHTGYGPPRPSAGPPVSVGPPQSFPSSRELPGLPSLGRPQGNNGMSISSILGGPSASRETPSSQYGSPIATSGPPNSMFGPTHASPRISTAGPDYAPFRRPQTPEHQRSYETRDHRANSAGSPPGMSHYSTPEARQFGTAYRGPVAEERREPIRVPNPNTIPPRPSSQPNSFNAPPPRGPEHSRGPVQSEPLFGRRVERVDNVARPAEPVTRAEPPYARPGFEERHNQSYGYAERERQEREAAIQRDAAMQRDAAIQREAVMQREAMQRDREREQRERERAEHERHQEYAHQLAQRNAQAYNRQTESREQPAWMRPGYENPRPAYEQTSERPPSQQQSNGYEYPATSAPQYGGHPAYASNEPRYGQASQPPPHNLVPASHYEAQMQERERIREHQQYQAQQRQQLLQGPPTQNGPAYQPQESPVRRTMEDSQQMQQQRSFLGVQEFNKRGRASPLPQAVQGAQGQINPGGEPSIKNEFGRMFSGIGSGVGGAMGVSSPVTASPQGIPFSNPGQLRRDDPESLQDSPIENGGHKIPRTASRGGRRRKLKEEDGKGDDESSTGRRTPGGRGKRAKAHHHHHHHHHHHRPEPQDSISPNLTPFKSVKGSAIPSPPAPDKAVPNLHHHHVPAARPHHHHHHVTPAKPSVPQSNPVIPLPRVTVRSKPAIDAVAHLPRHHLGQFWYQSTLKPAGPASPGRAVPSRRGFSSTPIPLPLEKGQENCTLTVKVSRAHLSDANREEITSRRAVWGTDIYTDDSDIIAACIHQGWFRGAWPDEVDVALLGLEIGEPIPGQQNEVKDVLTEPPATGPDDVPKGCDLHVDILVLGQLEKYGSTVRFGIKSREWGGNHDGYQGVHDGVSFMILSVRWVKGVDGEEGRSGIARRNIFSQQLQEDELKAEEAWGSLLTNGNGAKLKGNAQFEESFERGAVVPSVPAVGDIKGIGTNSWWKESNGVIKSKSKEQEAPINEVEAVPEPEKTNDDEHEAAAVEPMDSKTDIEKITERMVENANTAEDPVEAPISLVPAIVQPPIIEPPMVEPLTPPSTRLEAEEPMIEPAREVITVERSLGGEVEVKREIITDESTPAVPMHRAPPAVVGTDVDMSGVGGAQ